MDIFEPLLDVLLDSLLDSLKTIPFLFIAYALMEYIEHKSEESNTKLLQKSGKFGPLIGASIGLIPQCGLSAASASLYSARVISMGTVVAVFLATSDEMLPIMFSEGKIVLMLKLLLTKWIIGLGFGMLVDLILRKFNKTSKEMTIEDFCEREHCKCDEKEQHFLISALIHTGKIALFLFVTNVILGMALALIGEENIELFIQNKQFLSIILCILLGCIPNCAPSLIMTTLYCDGLISTGSLIAGLLINAGIGIAVLFRNNRPVKNSFLVLGILAVVSLICGVLIDLTPIHYLF